MTAKINTNMKVDLLSIMKTRHRQLTALPYYDPRYSHHFPFFTYGIIDLMMRDPRVKYGLKLIKGPIYAYTKFFDSEEAEDPAIQQAIIDLEYFYSYKVEAKNRDTEEFVIKMLNRFWNRGSREAMQALEWGYSPCQVIYKRANDGKIEYEKLIRYGVHHAKPVARNHDLIGIFLKKQNKYIPIPKSFVHVHQREYDQYTGRSLLYDAHLPWHETWNLGGARDIRRNWFFRNSYDGGTLYVPEGSVTLPDGSTITSEELGAQIMENSMTGSYRIIPNPPSGAGKKDRQWEYEGPRTNTTPQGMIEYCQDMRIEILEGMGIPPEVVENANSNGLGSASGRKIPLIAFYASLSPISIELIMDFSTQVIDPCLRVNLMDDEYEITRIMPKTFDPNRTQPDGSLSDIDPAADTTERNPTRSVAA